MVALARIPAVPAEEHSRRLRRQDSALAYLWDLLDAVKDPEVPALSLWDLGVLQDIRKEGEIVIVIITPTYSGCPAVAAMAEDIEQALVESGIDEVRVDTRLSPAWTTDWLSSDARQRLREYGIAAPAKSRAELTCPQCGSGEVKVVSEFGSTACKALYQCLECQEPFDYFKSI